MPPTTRGAASHPFLALWVEDGMAKLWRVDLTGPIDEIARFSVEGMPRTTVLEIAAQFAKLPARRAVTSDLALAEPSVNGATRYQGMGRPRKTDVPPKKRKSTRRPAGGRSHLEEQRARQAELFEALARHPEGINSQAIAQELGRGGAANVGVSLRILVDQGKAWRDDAGIWYPVLNGDVPHE